MNKLIMLVVAALAAATLAMGTAEAKRLGGGVSLGKQYSPSPMQRQAAPSRPSAGAPSAAAAPGARPSGASRWLGPLAGLAAGGLLASLFFGDGFEGLQILDFLLIAALVFGGIMLFKAMRGRAGPRPAAAGAGAYGAGMGSSAPRQDGMNYQAQAPLGGAAEGSAAEAPAWFDGAAFAEGAKTHFVRLQAAWDKGDFRDIREYVSPQLFAELQREFDRLGRQPQYTEVMTLEAVLLDTRREGDQLVASVQFTGLIREEQDAAATKLDEIWHVAHDWNTPEGNWTISGIQQSQG